MRGSFRFHERTVKLVLLALTFLLSSSLYAQIDTGSIVGIVKDPSGAVISGATVTLKNSATGVTRVVTTNQDGGYQFAAVTPGVYSVRRLPRRILNPPSATTSRLTCNHGRRLISH